MTTQDKSCVVCHHKNLTPLIDIPQVPVHCNVLWPTQQEAIEAPTGQISLAFCANCGHIFNTAFEPELTSYTQAYENSLHFSPRFQSYAESLATHLIEQHNLRHKDIIEIGCGQGDFLTLLCKLGQNRGVGFDPSYIPDPKKQELAQITFIQDFYSVQYAHYQADLIACRHVLEHIQAPTQFIQMVRQAIGDQSQTVIFFELPNALFTLRDLAIWDIIYEHCGYFTPSSLAYLFTQGGFTVTNVSEVYAGQFLGLEAFPAPKTAEPPPPDGQDLPPLTEYAAAFSHNYRRQLETWRLQLSEMANQNQKIVIWGSGSKGVTFLNWLNTQETIRYAVDINPRKQGKYIPGTGQQIVSPEFLSEYRPDAVIVMNPIYEQEIQKTLGELGLSTRTLLAM